MNRSLVKKILKKRHLLKNFPQYKISENLTLNRRVIHERVVEELTSYPFNWVSNGNVFVKKEGGRPIMVNTTDKLEELLQIQTENVLLSPKESPPEASVNPQVTSTTKQSDHVPNYVLPPGETGTSLPLSSQYAKATQENLVNIPHCSLSSQNVTDERAKGKDDAVPSMVDDRADTPSCLLSSAQHLPTARLGDPHITLQSRNQLQSPQQSN